MHFDTLRELLAKPEEQHRFLVDELLPHGGSSIIAGKPKAGKSTLARCLALSVARGEPWLGLKTVQGPVLYLAFEEKLSEVLRHFKHMGATEEPIRISKERPAKDAVGELARNIDTYQPALVIIDPLFRFIRARDANEYAGVTEALDPLMQLSRDSGAHLLLVHHMGKGDKTGADAILGSTAIYAAVDTALMLKATGNRRTLSSEAVRYGTPLEELILDFDPVTGIATTSTTRAHDDEAKTAEAIVEYLKQVTEPVLEETILEHVTAQTARTEKALRALVADGRVQRSGTGHRGGAYKYSLSVPASYGAEAERESGADTDAALEDDDFESRRKEQQAKEANAGKILRDLGIGTQKIRRKPKNDFRDAFEDDDDDRMLYDDNPFPD